MDTTRLPVVYVSPYYDPAVHSGANRRFEELVRRFVRDYGERFTLIVTKGKAPPDWTGKNLIEVDYRFNHWSKFSAAREIAKALDALPPSIVLVESIPIPFRALKRHKHFQVAYDFRYFRKESKGFWYRLAFSQYLKRQWGSSEFMVTCSEYSIDELQKYVGYPRERVVKSYFGIEEAVLTLAETPAPQKRFDVIYVGHFEKRKNHEPLIRALAHIDKDLRVLFNGRDNGLKSQLERLCAELGMRNVVFSGGKTDAELWQLYRESRVVAFPSVYEGFGIPLIEGLALGVPVAVSDIEVFHEVGGSLVSFFDPHSPEDIARVIRKQLEQPALPPPEAVREHLKKFFWEEIHRSFIADLESFSSR